jgi:hypothetical protein
VSVPCTSALGRFVELGDLPRQRDVLGTDNLLLVLLKSIGASTDTILRNCATFGAMLAAGAVEADFTNYNGGKVLGPADKTTTLFTASSPYKGILTIPATQVWNPAGGATNNAAIVRAVLLYRPTTGTAKNACMPLGLDTTTGGATGGTFSHAFGVLTDQAT